MSERTPMQAATQETIGDAAAVAGRALAYLRAEGALRTIDAEFAALLRRRFGADALVALAGALAMRAVALGHSGFALARAEAMLDALALRATLPPLDAWRAALIASPIVTSDAAARVEAYDRPVLLSFEDGRVSLRRYARYEQQLADALVVRCGSNVFDDESTDDQPIAVALARALHRLFAPDPHAAHGAHAEDRRVEDHHVEDRHAEDRHAAQAQPIDRQAFAAWRALHRHLLLITGGPGTGKTTTVARLLALQLIVADVRGAGSHDAQPLRIALAAPTGRAAVRLGEAIAERVARDIDEGRIDAGLAARIPRTAQTLHRLLGPRPGRVGFRHHAENPLPFDLVVVDEASMIDLPLMAKLVAAVAPSARLVLLGDPDQLPAVEAGDVLGALCAAAGERLALGPRERAQAALVFGTAADAIDDVDAVATDDDLIDGGLVDSDRADSDVIGADVPHSQGGEADESVAPLAGHRVHLLRGWRQAGADGLQALTDAVRRGDADTVIAQLQADDDALRWRHGEPVGLADWLRETVLPTFVALGAAADPAEALRLARRMRVLTALRRGPYGAEFWNTWCAAELGARETLFHGRLIAIAENSARHGLYNGDLGVLWRDAGHDTGHDRTHGTGEGGPVAWFESEGRLRAWRPGQLPAHTTAFATTVHKAQGSEFDTVALLLPDADSRVLGRELLYTALTRARRQVLLWAAPTTLRRALERRSLRDSGLQARLQRARSASVE